jgi:hypothetical protein
MSIQPFEVSLNDVGPVRLLDVVVAFARIQNEAALRAGET